MTNKIYLTITLLFFVLTYSCNNNKTYDIHVKFDKVDGLYLNDEVRVNGYKIGSVSKVDLSDNTIHATLTINKEQSISDAATFTIRNTDMIGTKHIDIDNFNGSQTKLSDGDTATGNFDDKNVLTSINIDTIVQKYAKPILDSLGYELTPKKKDNNNTDKK
ncbi:MAG: MCE family protein [Saprospiraceae bacterium]|nr:MCE family protein [Candidatus Vicinibacter proximus]